MSKETVALLSLILACFNTENGRGRAAMRNDDTYFVMSWKVSIPRTVVGGLQSTEEELKAEENRSVSIPRTVVGGLQSYPIFYIKYNIKVFQYRERSWEGCNRGSEASPTIFPCFNTENGRGRAAIFHEH